MSKISPNLRRGRVDQSNSTTTPLGSGATFNGSAINILRYAIIFVNIYTDQDSATDGLVIYKSSDATNWDFYDKFTIEGGSGKEFAINPTSKWLKVEYTNGGSPQTAFRLQTILKPDYAKESTHRIRDSVVGNDDSLLVKSVISYPNENDDSYFNVGVQNPFPVDGNFIYAKDINVKDSDIGDFSGLVTDLVDDIYSTITNSTANNPKTIEIVFNRTVLTTVISVGTYSGNFSNLKLELKLPNGSYVSIYDNSTDNTDITYQTCNLPTNLGINELRISFATTDSVSLSYIIIPKSNYQISRIQAVTPDLILTDINATRRGNLKIALQEYGDTPAIDAFGRARFSEPYTIFDSKQLHDKQPLFWDESIGGSATATHTGAYVNMAVTASSSDFGIRQTKQRFNYQPGKSQEIIATFYAPSAIGVTQRIGVFDGTGVNYLTPYNGIWFENDGGTLSFNIAKNGSTTETVIQSNWNYDTFDGTGPSGITLDMSAGNILLFDYEALMMGRVRVGFVIGGLIHYAHFFNHANDSSFTTPYFDTPNLALRYDIQSDGTNPGTLYHICSTVMSEGGIQQTGIIRSIDMGITHLDANVAGTAYAAIGIRLKSAYYDITAVPELFSIISLTKDDFRWRLVLNPTVAGTFTYSDFANSSIQYAIGTTANTVTGGTVIDSGYGQSLSVTDRRFITSLHLGSTISGIMDEIILDLTPYTAGADYLASLTVREFL